MSERSGVLTQQLAARTPQPLSHHSPSPPPQQVVEHKWTKAETRDLR